MENPTSEAPQTTDQIAESLGDIFHPEDITEEEVVEEVDEGLDEIEEPEQSDDDEQDEPLEAIDEVEVELDGDVFLAPKKVAEALMRNKDYTEKTQSLAAQRKEAEILQGEVTLRSEQFRFAQQVQPDLMMAQQLGSEADQFHQYLKDNIDTLSSVEVTKLQMAISEKRAERDNVIASVRTKQTEFQQAQEQSHGELLKKGTEVLRQKIPGWGEAQQKQVRSQGLAEGFTEAELSGVADPRQVLVLWKAAQYDALKSGAKPAVKAVQSAPSIKTKSRNPMSPEKGRELNLRKKMKSTNLTDKAKGRALEDYFADKLG